MQPVKKTRGRKPKGTPVLKEAIEDLKKIPDDDTLCIPEKHDAIVGEKVVGLSLRFEDLLGDDIDVSDFCDALLLVASYDAEVDNVCIKIPTLDEAYSPARFDIEMPEYPEDMQRDDFIKLYKNGIQAGIDKVSCLNKVSTSRGIFALSKNSQFSKVARALLFFFKASTQDVNQFLTLSPSVLASKIANYFQSALELKTSYTVPELAYAAGFASRRDMLEFLAEHYDTPNGFLLSRAMTIIEAQRNVEMIASSGIVAGHKEDLQSNFNWGGKKKSEKDVKRGGGVDVSTAPPQGLTLEEWSNAFLKKDEPQDQS